MRKCTQCSKPARLHITEIRDGNVLELHLCDSCAQDYLNPPEQSVGEEDAEGFLEKLAEFTSDEQLDEMNQIVCPNCGISFKEFRGQGRLGCPHDYIAFEAELLPLLESIHGELQHTGKYPEHAPGSSQKQYELIKLRNQLRAAVEQENYEKAADFRDQIQSLEDKMLPDDDEEE